MNTPKAAPNTEFPTMKLMDMDAEPVMEPGCWMWPEGKAAETGQAGQYGGGAGTGRTAEPDSRARQERAARHGGRSSRAAQCDATSGAVEVALEKHS